MCLTAGFKACIARNSENQVIGWGILKKGEETYRLNPLYADTPLAALALTTTLTNSIPENETFTLEIPITNQNLEDFMKKANLSLITELTLMQKNFDEQTFKQIQFDKIFSCT